MGFAATHELKPHFNVTLKFRDYTSTTKHQNDTNKIIDMNFNRSPSVGVRFGYKEYSGHANIMI